MVWEILMKLLLRKMNRKDISKTVESAQRPIKIVFQDTEETNDNIELIVSITKTKNFFLFRKQLFKDVIIT